MLEAYRKFINDPRVAKAFWLIVDTIAGLRLRPRIMALMAGALTALAQPPFGFLPGLFGYALLLYALERDLGAKPDRTAFFMGWLAGFGYFFVSCFWIAEAFLVDAKTYGWMAPFAAALLPAGIGLFWGTFALIYRRLAPKGMKRFLFFATLFCIFEMLRGTVLSGFPWNPAGSSWKAGGAMSQIAAYIGVYGLSFITVSVFCSVAVVRRDRGVAGFAPVIWAALVLVSCFGLGEVRLLTTKITLSDLRIRLVQPAVSQKAKWTAGAFDELFSAYVDMSKAPPKGGRAPDVIIWPEGALPPSLDVLLSNESWTAPVMAGLLADRQTLIMGTTRRITDPKGHDIWHNSMVIMHQDGAQTRIEGAYDKFKLVPFGEFTPFASLTKPLGIEALTHFDDSFTPGPRTKAVTFDHLPRMLPLICYEGIFPSLDMTNYKASADILRPKWIVNISNDAWFGPTTGPLQHLNLASYRAIEEGLPMVRSTPTGVSAIIDPLGRVMAGTEIGMGRRAYVDATVPNAVILSPYATAHCAFAMFCTIFCLILVAFDTCVRVIKKTECGMSNIILTIR